MRNADSQTLDPQLRTLIFDTPTPQHVLKLCIRCSRAAQVADLGLARVLEPGEGVVTTQTYGTVSHMPPELLVSGLLSRQADVYRYCAQPHLCM